RCLVRKPSGEGDPRSQVNLCLRSCRSRLPIADSRLPSPPAYCSLLLPTKQRWPERRPIPAIEYQKQIFPTSSPHQTHTYITPAANPAIIATSANMSHTGSPHFTFKSHHPM